MYVLDEKDNDINNNIFTTHISISSHYPFTTNNINKISTNSLIYNIIKIKHINSDINSDINNNLRKNNTINWNIHDKYNDIETLLIKLNDENLDGLSNIYPNRSIIDDKNYLSLDNLILPYQIKSFNCDYCNIYQLPQILPDSLIEISIMSNYICNLPEILPQKLKLLYSSFNNIYDFNIKLSDNIIVIEIGNNNLTSLPIYYPISLDEYDITNNNIKYLSKNMIDALITIYHSKCNPDFSIINGNPIFNNFENNYTLFDFLQN